jgi:hypothetical protein
MTHGTAAYLITKNYSHPCTLLFPTKSALGRHDGNWSTFSIRVGTPDQEFRVFISTVGQETWIPNVDGCTSNDVSNCGDLRGVDSFAGKNSSGFMSNAVRPSNSIFTSHHSRTKSSTWEYQDPNAQTNSFWTFFLPLSRKKKNNNNNSQVCFEIQKTSEN